MVRWNEMMMSSIEIDSRLTVVVGFQVETILKKWN